MQDCPAAGADGIYDAGRVETASHYLRIGFPPNTEKGSASGNTLASRQTDMRLARPNSTYPTLISFCDIFPDANDCFWTLSSQPSSGTFLVLEEHLRLRNWCESGWVWVCKVETSAAETAGPRTPLKRAAQLYYGLTCVVPPIFGNIDAGVCACTFLHVCAYEGLSLKQGDQVAPAFVGPRI